MGSRLRVQVRLPLGDTMLVDISEHHTTDDVDNDMSRCNVDPEARSRTASLMSLCCKATNATSTLGAMERSAGRSTRDLHSELYLQDACTDEKSLCNTTYMKLDRCTWHGQ